MIDNLLGGGDDDDSEESDVDDMDGGLFDAGDDDLMGGGDDLMGDGDDLMDGDEMGFDDMDGGDGATSAEMDNRIDELENEVASLSSTVNTVKSENEQISESVGNVEENVRKLLEVYEMVTRGVNPFVDESDVGDSFGAGGGTGGSMGLFEDDGGEDESIDTAVADASADEFFDDDFDDGSEFDGGDGFDDGSEFDGGEDGVSGDVGGEFEESFDSDTGVDGFEDDFDGDEGDLGGTEREGDGDGGKSFEELKAEYDSGEAEWGDEENGGSDASVTDEDETEIDEGSVADEGTDTQVDAANAAGSERESDAVEEWDTTDSPDRDTGSTSDADRSPFDGGKPYLETIPSGYVADLVVMDWLEFLVEEAGIDGAARTIAYYESIDWLDVAAAETLRTFLNGFGGDVESEPEPRSSLTVEHHDRSLRYVNRIANPNAGLVAFDERVDRGKPRPRPDTERTSRYPEGSFEPIERAPDTREVESDGGRDIETPDAPRPSTHRPSNRSAHSARDVEFDWSDEE